MALTDLLGSTITIGLSEKGSDRRAAAARELELKVQRTCAAGSASAYTWVGECIESICDELLSSTYANSRKGGLVALASVALGLRGNLSDDHVRLMITRCLASFSDEDAQVRYFACESVFNILKICRESGLFELPALLGGISKLLGDSEQDNRQAAPVLDRLLKEVVSEYYTGHRDFCDVVGTLESFLLLPNVYVRQLCLSWIQFMSPLKRSQFMDRVFKFLPFLFALVSGEQLAVGRKDIAVSAESVLVNLLDKIDSMSEAAIDQTTAVLVKYAIFHGTLGTPGAKKLLFLWIKRIAPLTTNTDGCADIAAAVVKSLALGLDVVATVHSELLNDPSFVGKVVVSAERLSQSLLASVAAEATPLHVSRGAVDWLLVVSKHIQLENLDLLFQLRLEEAVLRLAIKQFGVSQVLDRIFLLNRFPELVSILLHAANFESVLPEFLQVFLAHNAANSIYVLDLLRAAFASGLAKPLITSDLAKKSIAKWTTSCSVGALIVGVFADINVSSVNLEGSSISDLEVLVELIEMPSFESVRATLLTKPDLVKKLVGAAMRLDQASPAFRLLFTRLQLVSVFRSL